MIQTRNKFTQENEAIQNLHCLLKVLKSTF